MSKQMWNKFSKLLGVESTKDSSPNNEQHIVTAALMVRVSITHDDFSNAEKQNILKSIQKHFSLDKETSKDILDKAMEHHNEATDLYTSTRVIMKELDQEGQKEIVKLLYQVAFADNDLDHFEEQIIAKISGLLGISIRERVKIKQEIRVNLPIQ